VSDTQATTHGEGTPLGVLLTLAASSTAGVASYTSLKETLRTAVAEDPFDATVATVLGGAFLFYVAEKGHNPKVQTYWDALVFISTCLSVGYADIFARTPAGQAIASAIMTFGPAMSGALFDAPRARDGEPSDDDGVGRFQRAILDKLDAILVELHAARAP
jgi:hypothetical protein